MKKTLILTLIIFLLVGALAYTFTQLNSLKSQSQQNQEQSNWQTYKSEELGFEVSYPPEVEAHEDSDGGLRLGMGLDSQEVTETGGFMIAFYKEKLKYFFYPDTDQQEEVSLKQIVENRMIGQASNQVSDSELLDITIDGIDGYLIKETYVVEDRESETQVVFLPVKKYVFGMIIRLENSKNHQGMVDQIISTIKFTNK